MKSAEVWPALPLEEWKDTYDTLHMWTQVVGKTQLALTPLVNHFWNITMPVTPRRLRTRTMYFRDSGSRWSSISFITS